MAEHFFPPRHAIEAFARFLAPGGLLITVIPNLRGSIGTVERLLNGRVYRAHVPLTTDELRMTHEDAGLTVTFCRYFLSTNFGVLNLSGLASGPGLSLKAAFVRNLVRFSKIAWEIEVRAPRLKDFPSAG